ncbi:TPA: fimbrial protein [Pseudomonas aeruginosa]|nr:fimbrial protein [Pseudomonas aeruginosa]
MPSIRNSLLGMLLIAAAAPASSYALSCNLDPSRSAEIVESLGTALAVPADAPDGTIIWESEQRDVPVICADDYETGIKEDVYFYVNPGRVEVGKGIRVGIRYRSQAIVQNTGAVNTGYNSFHGCNWANCTGWDKARFRLLFSVFIEKYGETPVNGQVGGHDRYRVFQLDGRNGLNPRPNSNLNYVVTGINNIRFVPCSPELTFTPPVVNFPRAFFGASQVGQIASSANFSIGLVRTCETPYTVNMRFTPATGSASVIDKLLVPNNNNSVGIALTRQDTLQPVPFDTWFKLADLTTSGLIQNEFRADLIWRSAPVPGTFEATALVDMFYK